MKHLIIIGAGGLGRQIYAWAKECTGYEKEFNIIGFLDDNPKALEKYRGLPPVLGGVSNYSVNTNDTFVLAIGDNEARQKCISIIKEKGGSFITLIHPSSYVYCRDNIGVGTIVAPLASIGVDAKVGDYCLIQGGDMIGHDVEIGNNVRIDCNVVCVGGIKIKDNVCVHTGAVINHGVTIEENAVVGAMSFVIKKVKQGTTVFGIPARIL